MYIFLMPSCPHEQNPRLSQDVHLPDVCPSSLFPSSKQGRFGATKALSKVAAELHSSDISDLIAQLSVKKEEGLVDETLIKDLQIIQTLIGALKSHATAARVVDEAPNSPSHLALSKASSQQNSAPGSVVLGGPLPLSEVASCASSLGGAPPSPVPTHTPQLQTLAASPLGGLVTDVDDGSAVEVLVFASTSSSPRIVSGLRRKTTRKSHGIVACLQETLYKAVACWSPPWPRVRPKVGP
eukprot:gene23530-9054_t